MSFIEFLKSLFFRNKPSQKALPDVNKSIVHRPSTRDVWVLSIDGGGIRGIIPAFVLESLEDALKTKGGDGTLASYFDLITGTSTGGLIALSLAKKNPLTATELVDLYLHKNNVFFPPAKGFIERLLKEKYSTAPMEDYLNELFGSETFSDLEKNALILSYNIATSEVFPMSATFTPNFLLRLASRATTAAPTYYKPLSVMYNDKECSLIDGGVFANDPILWAYTEAKRMYKNCGKIHILSLGNFRKKPVFNTDSGAFSWLDITKGNLPIYTLYHTANQDNAEALASRFTDLDYIRIEYKSESEEGIKMDDTSAFSMNRLSVISKTVIEENKKLIGNTADKLIAHKKYISSID